MESWTNTWIEGDHHIQIAGDSGIAILWKLAISGRELIQYDWKTRETERERGGERERVTMHLAGYWLSVWAKLRVTSTVRKEQLCHAINTTAWLLLHFLHTAHCQHSTQGREQKLGTPWHIPIPRGSASKWGWTADTHIHYIHRSVQLLFPKPASEMCYEEFLQYSYIPHSLRHHH